MFIKKIKIENFKSHKNSEIELRFPDNQKKGSGLNIFIGENNSGKSSVFEILRKISLPSISIEEINYLAQTSKNEVQVTLTSHEDVELSYESRYFSTEDLDNKIHLTKKGFSPDLYHSNTSRRLVKNTSYTTLGNFTRDGKDEDIENKSDNYQIIKQIYQLNPQQRGDFSKIINEFLPEIKRVSVKSDPRQNRSILICKLLDDTEIDIRDMGSGIEQFIILLWVVKFGSSKVLLIDEPEISLHPKAQIKLSELLLESSIDKQIIVATHSPYVFKNCLPNFAGIFVFNKENNETKITDFQNNLKKKLFPWSPSWGEINYFAYDYVTVEFHNELYGFLQEKEQISSIADFDTFLCAKGILKTKDYTWSNLGKAGDLHKFTICTYIRNLIHHPDNLFNPRFTDIEFKESIENMLKLLV